MKKLLLSFLAFLSLSAAQAQERTAIKLFDEVTFYDGYLFTNNPDSLVDDGVLRHNTSLYAVRLTDDQLSLIGNSLRMAVEVKACCDNYDRIGNINLAFVPGGAEAYNPDSVSRIELGRFITPFMDKNKQPDTVPYAFDIDYVSHILRDAAIRADYDIWVEFELFGVPYAANQQVAGCSGRSDVFKGTLVWETSEPARPLTDKDVLVPIVMKKPEYKGHNLDNYSEQGTDTIGLTTKTYHFEVPRSVADAQLVLVTSNHGANSGGEEYNRRWHYVYYDDALVLSYKPGRTSCEPFRKYNTQANGIYGYRTKSDASWQSFSNWCPGDVIDNRIIELGPVEAGAHKVRISVPEAQFVGQQGDIPVSLFFQGLTDGGLTPIEAVTVNRPEVGISQRDGYITVSTDWQVLCVELYDLQGHCLYRADNGAPVPTGALTKGFYLLNVELATGLIETHKIVVK